MSKKRTVKIIGFQSRTGGLTLGLVLEVFKRLDVTPEEATQALKAASPSGPLSVPCSDLETPRGLALHLEALGALLAPLPPEP